MRFGFKCRFLGGHTSKDEEGNIHVIVDDEKKARTAVSMHEINFLDVEILKMLRTKKVCGISLGFFSRCSSSSIQYPTPIADSYLQNLHGKDADKPEEMTAENAIVVAEPEQDEMSAAPLSSSGQNVEETIQKRTGSMLIDEDDVSDVPPRFAEKKRLHWTGKTCGLSPVSFLQGSLLGGIDLAPLTTVGNLVRLVLENRICFT